MTDHLDKFILGMSSGCGVFSALMWFINGGPTSNKVADLARRLSALERQRIDSAPSPAQNAPVLPKDRSRVG